MGTNSDSFVEYLAKAAFAGVPSADYGSMFTQLYSALLNHSQRGDYFLDAQMSSGATTSAIHTSLANFFPGLRAQIGDMDGAERQLHVLQDEARCGCFRRESGVAYIALRDGFVTQVDCLTFRTQTRMGKRDDVVNAVECR